jgi:hypothetical protein
MRRRVYRYVCPACGGYCHDLSLTTLGGKVRPEFRTKEVPVPPAVTVLRVLCWWCRTFHPPEEVQSCMKIPERRASLANGIGSSSNALDAGPLKEYCEILVFLTDTQATSGHSRKLGNLSLKCALGRWGLTLNDAETGQYCFLEGDRLADLLLHAECGLSDGSLPWRPSNFQGRGKK